MFYRIIVIGGLLLVLVLLALLARPDRGEQAGPPPGCCGAHAVCEKALKKSAPVAEYFDDEELDLFRGIPPDAYTPDQIETFRDILYTLRPDEVSAWLASIEKRAIALPGQLRQEALSMSE
jgi:hypothetical protein